MWVGALLGRYVALPNEEAADVLEAPDGEEWGPSLIMGFDPIGSKGLDRASLSNAWSDALNIRFPLASWGASVSDVMTHRGLTVGLTTVSGTPKTSLSIFSVGNGTVALFGDAPRQAFTYSAEDVVAHDIARLIVSGLLENPGVDYATLLDSTEIQIRASGEATISFPIGQQVDATVMRVVVHSLVDHDPLLGVEDVLL